MTILGTFSVMKKLTVLDCSEGDERWIKDCHGVGVLALLEANVNFKPLHHLNHNKYALCIYLLSMESYLHLIPTLQTTH